MLKPIDPLVDGAKIGRHAFTLLNEQVAVLRVELAAFFPEEDGQLVDTLDQFVALVDDAELPFGTLAGLDSLVWRMTFRGSAIGGTNAWGAPTHNRLSLVLAVDTCRAFLSTRHQSSGLNRYI